MILSINVNVALPQMPNFLQITSVKVEGPKGTESSHSIPVGELTDDQIGAVSEAWSKAFREHCVSKRNKD